MRAAQPETAKRETLNLRIRPEVGELIDRAGTRPLKNGTDFVLDAARRAAEDTLLYAPFLRLALRHIVSFLRAWMLRRSRTSSCGGACRHRRRGNEPASFRTYVVREAKRVVADHALPSGAIAHAPTSSASVASWCMPFQKKHANSTSRWASIHARQKQ